MKIKKGADISGVFTGSGGQTVRVMGKSSNQDEWVYRAVWNNRKKANIMNASNMTHLTKFGLQESGITCEEHMFELDRNTGIDGEDSALYW